MGMGTAHVPRVQTVFRTLSLRTFDTLGARLRCKCKDQFKILDILCIFATSGGVHALTND